MTDDFEPVERGPDAPTDLFISVNPAGVFYIPSRVYDEFFDGEEYVAVSADTSNQRLAIEPRDDADDANVYPLRWNDSSGVRFSSRKALSELGVEMDGTFRLDPEWTDDLGAIVVSFAEHMD